MRSVLSLSLPPQKKKEIEKRAKKMGFSVSAYILHSVDMEQRMISEDELVERIEEAEKNYMKGNVKKLNSLRDLMK